MENKKIKKEIQKEEEMERCTIIVKVKWLDGCKKKYECEDYKTCDGILVLDLICNCTKYIPLAHVRWYIIKMPKKDEEEIEKCAPIEIKK